MAEINQAGKYRRQTQSHSRITSTSRE